MTLTNLKSTHDANLLFLLLRGWQNRRDDNINNPFLFLVRHYLHPPL